MSDEKTLTPLIPYLFRGYYEWIADNGGRPHIAINPVAEGVQVPEHLTKDDQLVLNIAMNAVVNLELGNEYVTFGARFNTVHHDIVIPFSAIRGIFSPDIPGVSLGIGDGEGSPPVEPPKEEKPKPHLTRVSVPPKPSKPHLTIVK